ncbi:MAG: NeuD/PglB/VioB family sugar acetyltransferase [Pseudomonadota bacterium]
MTVLRIIGAGGHGKVVAETAQVSGFDDVAFLDAAWPNRTENGRWRVVGKPETGAYSLFCAVGRNAVRSTIFDQFDLWDSPVLRHPSAVVSPSATLGGGVVVVAGAIVNADARLGHGVILNTGCSVDHDCTVSDFAHLSPGARLAGGVRVGARSWVGIGAVVREGVHVGADVTVGAGAVVVADIEDGATVVGVPARRI